MARSISMLDFPFPYSYLFSIESSFVCANMTLNVSLKQSNALGRGSTTLADAITMNKPSNPRICHSGINERMGSGVFSGRGVIKTGVDVGSICIGVDVAK